MSIIYKCLALYIRKYCFISDVDIHVRLKYALANGLDNVLSLTPWRDVLCRLQLAVPLEVFPELAGETKEEEKRKNNTHKNHNYTFTGAPCKSYLIKCICRLQLEESGLLEAPSVYYPSEGASRGHAHGA